MESPIWRGRDAELRPFGNIKASDSANLDMVAEVLSFSLPDTLLFIAWRIEIKSRGCFCKEGNLSIRGKHF